MEQRNMRARNFGLRSRDMGRALVTAYQIKSNGDNTKNNCKSPLEDFAKNLKEQGINTLNKVNKEHVMAYAESLSERYENGELSASSVQNYLSKVNIAMENARLDQECRVRPVKDAGLPKKIGIAKSDKSATKQLHNAALKSVSKRLGVQLKLQREIGLRFKESSLIDAKSVLKHAEQFGKIRIEDGTKGGRPREFSIINKQQINALKRAAEMQGNSSSLIPDHQNWRQYQNECYRQINKTNLNFHAERHHYANERYQKISGVMSPVRAMIKHGLPHHQYIAKTLNISLADAKSIDQNARLQLSQELGHCRISITNNYLG